MILSELEAIGVRVDERGLCSYQYAGNEVSEPVQHSILAFDSHARQNKEHLIQLWDELVKHLSVVPLSFYEGSESTCGMFINALRQTNRLSRRFKRFEIALPFISKILRMDSKVFSEGYMATTVEYSICVEWVFHLIRSDIYKSYLLEMLVGKDVTASAQMGHVDLPMSARVQVLDQESEDDFEMGGMLHPTYTRKFRQQEMQNNHDAYDIEDRVYRLMNEPYHMNRRDERQPNRSLSRQI